MMASVRLAAVLLLLVGLPLQIRVASAETLGFRPPVVAVATQNQYFGADLTPLVTAPPDQANAAFLAVLGSIAASDFPARARRQAREIVRRGPHLVALQEVLALDCIDPPPVAGPGKGCDDPLIAGARVDFLAVTLAALEAAGARYRAVAVVENFDTRGVVVHLDDGGEQPLPGLPVLVGADLVFITALDRDVILARKGIARRARPVEFPDGVCDHSLDGCNYAAALPVHLNVPGGGIDLAFERGFVGVDVRLRGQPYRFVTTHLEVPEPVALIQSAQIAQLIGVLDATTPPRRQLIVSGDINSSPEDEADPPIVPPYQQLLAAGFTDAWTLRPRLDPGFTCCQAADLLNPVSSLDQRIDVVFTRVAPQRAQVQVYGDRQIDRTRSGLWPSDHAGVFARLLFPSGPAETAMR